jgi:hypothetical protein
MGTRASFRGVPKACAAAALLVLALAGCRARRTGPDANYDQGARIYHQLYAQELDEAYADPRMDEAAALLRKVDPRSVDAEAARNMLASIEDGRAAIQKQRSDREKMAAGAASATRPPSSLDPQKILAAAAPDSGTLDPYGPGAAIADINAATGGCLIEGEPFREQGTGATGTVYRLSKSQPCTDKLPGLSGQVVLASNGRIYRRTADPTVRPAVPPDAGQALAAPAVPPATPAPPDAGAPPRPTPPAAQATDADAGESQLYFPGMPIPEGAQDQSTDR